VADDRNHNAEAERALPIQAEPTGERSSGAAHDVAATVPVPLVDRVREGDVGTPPPLPPSPASAAGERWLEEDAPTRPAGMADLVAASQVGPLPTPPTSPGSTTAETVRHLRPEPREVQPALRGSPRGLFVLTAATALAVGLATGALLFRARGTTTAQPPGAPTLASVTASSGGSPGGSPGGPDVAAVCGGGTAAPVTRCHLVVAALPEGGEVSVNGAAAGMTPLDLADAPCGEALIEIANPSPIGHGWHAELTLEPGTTEIRAGGDQVIVFARR
jgi:hypothetical protein